MPRLIRRILIGLVGLVLALVVLLAGSVVVDRLAGRGRLDRVTNARLPGAGGPEVRAYVARPSGSGPHPAVIMIHEFWGLNDDIVGKAQALAQVGYVVVAPDLFRGSTTGWVPSAIFQAVATPQSQIAADLDAVFAWLAAQPDVAAERIGIMGFCFGGGTSLRYSLLNPRLGATVILYGSLVTEPDQLAALPGPVLGIFGGADFSIPLSDVQAFEAALTSVGVPNQISVYEGQPHAFVGSIEAIRQGGPQAEAWNEVLAFLKQALQDVPEGLRLGAPAPITTGPDWEYWLRLAYEHALGGGRHHD